MSRNFRRSVLPRFVDGGPPGCRNTREAANVAGASGLRQAVIKKSPRYPDRAAIIIRRENTLGVGGRDRHSTSRSRRSAWRTRVDFPPSVKYLLSGAGAVSRGRASGAILPRLKPKRAA